MRTSSLGQQRLFVSRGIDIVWKRYSLRGGPCARVQGSARECGDTCILVTARMRSAKLKRARQSLETILAVEGAKSVVLFSSPDIQKRSGQWHQFKVELAEHLTAQSTAGSTSWVGRYQSSSASMNSIVILCRCSPIHVTRNHSLTTFWVSPLTISAGV